MFLHRVSFPYYNNWVAALKLVQEFVIGNTLARTDNFMWRHSTLWTCALVSVIMLVLFPIQCNLLNMAQEHVLQDVPMQCTYVGCKPQLVRAHTLHTSSGHVHTRLHNNMLHQNEESSFPNNGHSITCMQTLWMPTCTNIFTHRHALTISIILPRRRSHTVHSTHPDKSVYVLHTTTVCQFQLPTP
jgi:hypothetical protein